MSADTITIINNLFLNPADFSEMAASGFDPLAPDERDEVLSALDLVANNIDDRDIVAGLYQTLHCARPDLRQIALKLKEIPHAAHRHAVDKLTARITPSLFATPEEARRNLLVILRGPDTIEQRERLLTIQNNDEAVSVVSRGSDLTKIVAEPYRYIVVQRRNGEVELRIRAGSHTKMKFPSEKIVGAGYVVYSLDEQRLNIDGNSGNFATFFEKVPADNTNLFLPNEWEVAADSGLSTVEAAFRNIVGAEILIGLTEPSLVESRLYARYLKHR